MDIDYKEVIDFSKLKDCIKNRRTTLKYVAEDCGLRAAQISQIIQGFTLPKTDTVAKICAVLKVRVSEISEFKEIQEKEEFKNISVLYDLSDTPEKKLSYKPLWAFIHEYLKYHPDKTPNDIFDAIEPYRKRNGNYDKSLKGVTAANAAKNRTGEKKENRNRRSYSSGLPLATRTKLRNDRPMSMRTIYDICRYFGCTVDFVLGYK